MSSSAPRVLWRGLQREAERRAVAVLGAATIVSCLALAAHVRFQTPWSPAPFTLQTFFVYVAGASFGANLATVALSAYFLLGGIGLPIFTANLFGPTTGYLVGFVVAARLVATLVRRAERPGTVRIALAMAAGGCALLAFGAAYLGVFCGLGWSAALGQGALLFLPAEAVKIAAAAAFCRSHRDRLRVLFP